MEFQKTYDYLRKISDLSLFGRWIKCGITLSRFFSSYQLDCNDGHMCEWTRQPCHRFETSYAQGTRQISCTIQSNFLGFVGYAKVRAFLPKRNEYGESCSCTRCLCTRYDKTGCISSNMRMTFTQPQLLRSTVSTDEAKITVVFPVDNIFCLDQLEQVSINYKLYKTWSENSKNVGNTKHLNQKIVEKLEEKSVSLLVSETTNSCSLKSRTAAIMLSDLETGTSYKIKVNFSVMRYLYPLVVSETATLNFTTFLSEPSDRLKVRVLPLIVVISVALAMALLFFLYKGFEKCRGWFLFKKNHWKPNGFDDTKSYLEYLFNRNEDFRIDIQVRDCRPDVVSTPFTGRPQPKDHTTTYIPEKRRVMDFEVSPRAETDAVAVASDNGEPRHVTIQQVTSDVDYGYEATRTVSFNDELYSTSRYIAKDSF